MVNDDFPRSVDVLKVEQNGGDVDLTSDWFSKMSDFSGDSDVASMITCLDDRRADGLGWSPVQTVTNAGGGVFIKQVQIFCASNDTQTASFGGTGDTATQTS